MRPESRKYGRSRVPGYVVRCTAAFDRLGQPGVEALPFRPGRRRGCPVHLRRNSERDSPRERLVGCPAPLRTDRQVFINGVSERLPELHDGLSLKRDDIARIDDLAVEDPGIVVEGHRRPVSVILHHGFCPLLACTDPVPSAPAPGLHRLSAPASAHGTRAGRACLDSPTNPIPLIIIIGRCGESKGIPHHIKGRPQHLMRGIVTTLNYDLRQNQRLLPQHHGLF